jgi:hypothetical protein
LKSTLVRASSLSTLPSAYDDFLYAPIGESSNGALLTVLSVLARQNLDPWSEAADLSRMPQDTAARRLISMITVSPVQSAAADQAAIADRLIALLPRRIAAIDGAPDARAEPAAAHPSPRTINLVVITIYIGVMILSQWIATSIFERPQVQASAPAPLHPAPPHEETASSSKMNENSR